MSQQTTPILISHPTVVRFRKLAQNGYILAIGNNRLPEHHKAIRSLYDGNLVSGNCLMDPGILCTELRIIREKLNCMPLLSRPGQFNLTMRQGLKTQKS